MSNTTTSNLVGTAASTSVGGSRGLQERRVGMKEMITVCCQYVDDYLELTGAGMGQTQYGGSSSSTSRSPTQTTTSGSAKGKAISSRTRKSRSKQLPGDGKVKAPLEKIFVFHLSAFLPSISSSFFGKNAEIIEEKCEL